MITKKSAKAIEQLRSKFTYPPQNWEKFIWLLESKQAISFYSWECPPRQKVTDKRGTWVNLDVDIKAVVSGTKLDYYTELPRLTSQSEQEKSFIQIISNFPNTTYTKIIADTNGLYLFPLSKKILGQEKILKLSKEFKKQLGISAKKLIGNNAPRIVQFTDLMTKFRSEYEFFFYFVLENFNNKSLQLIPEKILDHWMERISYHMGMSSKERQQKTGIIKRTIASYCAEGMIFALLEKSNILPNPVWANFEEPPENGETTEILRKRYGIDQIPILYFVREEDHL